jgi:hypothetical protein
VRSGHSEAEMFRQDRYALTHVRSPQVGMGTPLAIKTAEA